MQTATISTRVSLVGISARCKRAVFPARSSLVSVSCGTPAPSSSSPERHSRRGMHQLGLNGVFWGLVADQIAFVTPLAALAAEVGRFSKTCIVVMCHFENSYHASAEWQSGARVGLMPTVSMQRGAMGRTQNRKRSLRSRRMSPWKTPETCCAWPSMMLERSAAK
jgi:hypothetical protein